MAGLFPEIWAKDIKEGVFANNLILSKLKDRSSDVLGGVALHMQQAGDAPVIETGDTISYPLDTVERQDEDLTFALRNFATPVLKVTRLTELQLQTAYRQSVLNQSQLAMKDKVTAYVIAQLIKASSAIANTKMDGTAGTGQAATLKLETTGASMLSSIHESGQDRKALTFADIRKVAERFDRMNVPMEDRVAVISAAQYYALFGDTALTYRDPYGFDFKNNKMPNIHGFDVVMRSTVGVQSTAGVAKDMSLKTASIASTDDAVSIFYQKQSCFKAEGQIDVFFQLKDPKYQSDTFSYLTRAGAGREYKNSFGVCLMKEAKIV